MVLDSLAFDYGPAEESWKCVEGGTTLLTESMLHRLKHKPLYNRRVTRMALDRQAPNAEQMVVTTHFNDVPRRYASVINTTTLPCLDRIDTDSLDLPATARFALRNLQYDSATKVAVSRGGLVSVGFREGVSEQRIYLSAFGRPCLLDLQPCTVWGAA